MKERPILFSAPMVNAILAGRKTQTRRLFKPEDFGGDFHNGWPLVVASESGCLTEAKSPYGVRGDRLWVKETFHPDVGRAIYAADFGGDKEQAGVESWKPSIFMPRCESRITLEVTNVHVEQLQGISEQDAKAEGLNCLTKDGSLFKYGIADCDGWPGNDDYGWHWHEWEKDPRAAYRKLWDSINGDKAPWASNPWVWVVEFRRIQ